MVKYGFKMPIKDSPLGEEVQIESLYDGFDRKDLLVITKEHKTFIQEKRKVSETRRESHEWYHIKSINTHAYQFTIDTGMLESICTYERSFKEEGFNYSERKLWEAPLPTLSVQQLREAYQVLLNVRMYLQENTSQNLAVPLILSKIEKIIMESTKDNGQKPFVVRR